MFQSAPDSYFSPPLGRAMIPVWPPFHRKFFPEDGPCQSAASVAHAFFGSLVPTHLDAPESRRHQSERDQVRPFSCLRRDIEHNVDPQRILQMKRTVAQPKSS